MVILSRGIAGLGDGLMYPTLLVYVAEIASKELRSPLSNFVNTSFCFGLIITYVLSIFRSWRFLNWILILPPVLTMLSMLMLPESPYWLAVKNRPEDAKKALSWLRSNEESPEEVKEITEKCSETAKSMKKRLKMTLNVLRSKSFWKPFLLAEPFNILYICSGLSLMNFYIVIIFKESGSSVDKVQASLIVASWRLILSLFASFALLKIPRRPLFLFTTMLTVLSQASLGTFVYFRSSLPESFGWVPLLLVLLIYAGSQLGVAPIIKVKIIMEIMKYFFF